MTQLIRTKKHQRLPLVKTNDPVPEVEPDRPTELIKKTNHNSLAIRKEQVYPPTKRRGLEHTKTEVYIGAASGFNNDSHARRKK